MDQFVVQCEKNKKFETVFEILRSVELKCCIIFLNTKDFLNKLEAYLSKNGYKVSKLALGIVSDEERNEIIKKVHEGAIKVLLTTDVLSCGVDFRLVNIVINLDAPCVYIQNGSRPSARPLNILTQNRPYRSKRS